jgi:hypothetical protein
MKRLISILMVLALLLPLPLWAIDSEGEVTGSVLNFQGWETGTFIEVTASTGLNNEVVSSPVKTGRYAFHAAPTTGQVGYNRVRRYGTNGAQINLALSTTAFYLFAFRTADLPDAGDEQIFRVQGTGVIDKFTLRLADTGQLVAYDTNASALATSTLSLELNRWYKIEAEVGHGASADWEVWVDDVSVLSGTDNLGTGNHIRADFGKGQNINSNAMDMYYDDVVIDLSRIGGGRVKASCVVGDGNYTAWTGDWTDVDEIPHDSDTTFITTSTSGDAETVALQSAMDCDIFGRVNAVKSFSIIRDEGGVSAFQTRIRSATTDTDTFSLDPGTTYSWQAQVYNLDPATGAAWITSALDSVEVGVEANANVAHRATSVGLMVLFAFGRQVIEDD